MHIQKFAAFSDGGVGGNPAGVVITDRFPAEQEMRRLAAQVGFSETVFAVAQDGAWRVRYFSPESEVPFCGHATIALGAALALAHGGGRFRLQLNQGEITVDGERQGELFAAALQSPGTHSRAATPELTEQVLKLFGYSADDLDLRIPPTVIHGGADHFVLALKRRDSLAAMRYALDAGRELMNAHGWITILLVYAESAQYFHSRNAFASGGVYEDPATGAATAAFAGYLRELGWPHGGAVELLQGEDMGARSRLHAAIPATPGSSIRVSGTARQLPD
ncbi:PhzF family phenazine biosynthesis protein [Permianibacter sp. IMCC34836]|uniref:PhzF family phenazine biosynthesis protein n=1 Tax=Permianibacter fluminis TaxID=2738515 RepID=UPI001554CB62|nr:PhzF family phenazine biosynthesis protein [Permianibacter fluminis]NQD37989.1 PhzF family phenazine biosynthesis protein [Permianibacter fluminis]